MPYPLYRRFFPGYYFHKGEQEFFPEDGGGEEGGKDHPKDPYASKRTPVTLKDPLKTLFSQIRGQAHPRVTEVCSPRFGLPKGFFVPLIT